VSETFTMTTSTKDVGESPQAIEPEELSLIDRKDVCKPLTWNVGGLLLFFFLPVDR